MDQATEIVKWRGGMIVDVWLFFFFLMFIRKSIRYFIVVIGAPIQNSISPVVKISFLYVKHSK